MTAVFGTCTTPATGKLILENRKSSVAYWEGKVFDSRNMELNLRLIIESNLQLAYAARCKRIWLIPKTHIGGSV